MKKESNNFKNKKRSKLIKVFAVLIVMLLQIFMPIFTGTSNVYAATTTTVTWTGDLLDSNPKGSITYDGVTLTSSNDLARVRNNFYDYGSNTFSISNGKKFTKIEIVCERCKEGIDGTTREVIDRIQPEPELDPDWWVDIYKVTWTGNASEFTTASDIFGISKIVFTIELPPTSNVTLHTNDGIINSGNITEYVEGTGAALPTAEQMEREGYEFVGWYANEGLTGEPVTSIGSDATGDKEYWAKWNEIIPGEAEVKEVEGNVGNATISLNNQTIEDLIELSADEQNAIATGKNISVFVEVADIGDLVSNEDKELVENKLENDSVVGMYLDINLFKQVEGEEATKVTETNDKIKISFEIPESLRSSNREFYIIRVHGTEVTKITPTVNGNTLTFETDRFSTYALAYTDTTGGTTTTGTNTNTTGATNDSNNPQTGDNVVFYALMLGLSIIGLAGAGIYTKKKRVN